MTFGYLALRVADGTLCANEHAWSCALMLLIVGLTALVQIGWVGDSLAGAGIQPFTAYVVVLAAALFVLREMLPAGATKPVRDVLVGTLAYAAGEVLLQAALAILALSFLVYVFSRL